MLFHFHFALIAGGGCGEGNEENSAMSFRISSGPGQGRMILNIFVLLRGYNRSEYVFCLFDVLRSCCSRIHIVYFGE